MTQTILSDFKKYIQRTKTGYKATLGYSSSTTVDLKIKNGITIPLDRSLFFKVEFRSFLAGSTVYMDKDFNIIDMIDERVVKVRK